MYKSITAGLVMAALMAVPALAVEEGASSEGMPAVEASAMAFADDGEKVVCPHCGRSVVMGRHGGAGQGAVCPYCGREVCAAEEAEKELCIGADAGFMSKYVSSGVTLSDDPVFQPDVWLTYRGFGVSVWGNMDLTDYNDAAGDFNELDFTGTYTWQLDSLGLTAGGIYYVFPATGDDDTAELYAAATYDVLLQPTLSLYYDVSQGDGLYATLGIGHSFDIPLPAETLSAALELSAQAGFGTKEYNEYNSGTYHTTFTDMVFTAGLPVTVYENYAIKPVVSWSSAFDHTIRTKNSHNDNVIWGVVASASF